MPIIKHLHQDYLRDRKVLRLEELAELDVDSALPPTDGILQDRAAVLEDIRRLDAELATLGIDTDYGFAVWTAEGYWEAERAREDE
jgi:hypothetical protein